MSANKLDVFWSPVHHDKFIIWGSDLTLYQVSRLKDIEKITPYTQISSTRGATVIASQSANGVRCVDLCPIPEQSEPLLALGHSNGRVSIAGLKQAYDPLGLVGREFNPRYPRLCNSVSWSHVENNLLAVAMEKHRSDHCILLWDINRGSSPPEQFRSTEAMPAQTVSPKPIAEMGLSETAHSVAWSNCSNRTLLASMNLKYIKIFDLRELSNKGVLVATSRYCQGVCADPWGPWQLASRGESVVCVWDARALARPLLALPQPRPVARVLWCPTRRNLLLSLQRDSGALRLHDIQQTSADVARGNAAIDLESGVQEAQTATAVEAELEEYERGPGVLERDVSPAPGGGPGAGPGVLAAVAWHPANEAQLLAVYANGGVCQYTVMERVTLAWGGGQCVWSCAGGLRAAAGSAAGRLPGAGSAGSAGSAAGCAAGPAPDAPLALQDVAWLMRRRAQTHYGLKADLWQNADLAEDEALSGMWHFLALSKSLVEDGCIRNSLWRHPGVRGVVRGEAGYRSEAVVQLVPDAPHRRVTLYRSAERARALALCGWGWGWDGAAAGVERAEAEGTPCRAAALAAFHLRLRLALDVLTRAQEPQLRVVALALAGLGDERLWRDALPLATPALPDPYLRALLRFLAAAAPAATAAAAAPDAALDAVLEPDMRLEDRAAFACLYLADQDLHDYVARTADALVEQGDLAGILLTGMSPEGVRLLQKWLEKTGDVQTVALVAARCLPPDLARAPGPQAWLQEYRSLLDCWRLWGARSALDTWASGAGGAGAGGGAGGPGGAELAERAVAVACVYCGKPVAAPPAARRARARLPPPAAKMKQLSSCPNCRKPLPRCGVCSLHLGGAGVGAGAGGAGGVSFGGWFSWCVACRHGGHADHLLHWFKEHTECPVSSCNCHCSTLDPPDRCQHAAL